MASQIERRKFLATLLGGAGAWPLAARAQQPAMPVVGYLDLTTSRPNPIVPPGFREGLAAAGFVEGRNVTIEARFARNQGERLAQFAAELVERKVAVIVALDLGSPGLCGEGCHLDNSNCFQAFQRSD